MTAVTRQAEAILQALIMISNSISMSFTSADPVCTMYTSSPRTDSPISTLKQRKKLKNQTHYKTVATPENIAVTTPKFEQCGFTIEKCVQKM